MTGAAALNSHLLDGLVAAGRLSPAWREVLARVQRHRFIPDRVWTDTDQPPLERGEDPQAWLEACYADQPLITQIDDGDNSGRGYHSSSASMPTTVAMMLDALDVEPGMRVLEIGTGTGWNAALLAQRVGTGNVVSVEVDQDLADRARRTLRTAGYPLEVVAGDGALGHPVGAPYERVLCTAAVQQVPHAWVSQTAPGGRIVTPWGTALHNGALLRLDVAGDGTASGRFDGNVSFMWVRGQRTPHGTVEDRVRPEHAFTETTTRLHPYPVLSFDACFAIGLRVPAAKLTVVFDEDDPTKAYTVFLIDPYQGSWASWRVEPGRDEYVIRQYGPRRLFAEVEEAYRRWVKAGEPEHTRFGVTVSEQGQQVWWDDARGARHRVPAACSEAAASSW